MKRVRFVVLFIVVFLLHTISVYADDIKPQKSWVRERYCSTDILQTQGFDIYNGNIIQMRASTSSGLSDTFSIIPVDDPASAIRDLPIASGHGDSASFVNEFFTENDKYPLIYVTADTTPAIIYVNRIIDGGSELIKTIQFPTDLGGYYAAHAYDVENQIMYLVGYTNNDFKTARNGNQMLISAWDMTVLKENDDGTVTPEHLRSCTRDFIYVAQGQQFHDGLIWISSGYISSANQFVYAIDPYDGSTVQKIDLRFAREVEGLSFISENEMVVGFSGGEYIKYTQTDENIPTDCSFSDVPVSSSQYSAISWSQRKNIANGYTDGTFRPNNGCTRGQIITFLWRMAGKPEPHANTITFPDVKTSHPFYKAIQWAAENNITNGYTSGSKRGQFGINDPCTRGQIAMFLWRYAGKPAIKFQKQTFKDVSFSHPYYNAIQWAFEAGITTGYIKGSNAGKFGVHDRCTRGQTVTFLYRVLIS